MNIQRISFECRGQDFLWWEIDMETGRIVGCGPFQAGVWANGRCSVDLATLAVGIAPTFHGPATEPAGRRLAHKVVAIEPAPVGEFS